MRQDDLLRQRLGYWSLVATGVGGVVGSGWLFASLFAAQASGPAALLAWVVGGLLMLCVALVFAELGMVKPESGGLVRYPMYSNGPLAAAIVGWCMWVAYVANPPTEAAGVLQYASAYLPGVYRGSSLTLIGIVVAIGLMAVFVAINYFGVVLFARTNNAVTAIKVLVPTVTVVALFAAGFHSGNFTHHGGIAPYGYTSALGAIATAGLVFAYTGFRNIVEMSGEAKNPRRTIPAALITTIVFAIVLYLALQIAFLGAVPGHDLIHGWHGVNLSSPFAQLALSVNLTWLYWILIADSMVSPSGSAIVFTGGNARNIFGLAKNSYFPQWAVRVSPKWGVPTRALLINFVVGVALLVPLPSWHAIISVSGALAVFTFAIGSVSLLTFRRVGLAVPSARIPGMQVVAPIAFVVSTMVIFWVPWGTLAKTIPILAAGLVVYVIGWLVNRHRPADLVPGVWLAVYVAVMYVLSWLGSFGGRDVIPAPWDSIVAAGVGVVAYAAGVASGTHYMRNRPEQVQDLREQGDLARGELAVEPG